MTKATSNLRKYKGITLHRTRIVAYAFYRGTLSMYPITVEDLEMDSTDARIQLDYETATESAVIVPADAAAWLIWCEYDGTAAIRYLGVTHNSRSGDVAWLERALEAHPEDL